MDDGGELCIRAKALAEAEAIQRHLSGRVEIRPLRAPLRTIAAVDADYGETLTYAAALLFWGVGAGSDRKRPVKAGKG